jgi:hypothetical protein
MPFSGENYIVYSNPRPFTVPIDWARPVPGSFGFFADIIDRQSLHYSAVAIEEIMFNITAEYKKRAMSLPQWKVYKNSVSNFDTFTKPNTQGTHLQNTPVKWFPKYIEDIQAAIVELITDTKVPDSIGALQARVFANGVGRRGSFDNVNKLKDNINTLNGVLNPLTNAQNGEWAFGTDYVRNCISWMGITPRGAARVVRDTNGTKAAIRTTDPNWPKSVIGEPSGISTLIDGIDVPMVASRRPDFSQYPRREADGEIAYDQGYGMFAHVPHVLQMVRYQPPLVEWFPTNITPRHYVSRLYSNTTSNLNWYLAQPVTGKVEENWGYWLIEGFAGVNGGQMYLKAYHDPQAAVGSQGNCPYPWLYPPRTAFCGCGWVSSAHAIWWSSDFQMFEWDEKQYQQLTTPGQMKTFSRHCKLRVSVSFASNGGENVSGASFAFKVQTAKIGWAPKNPPWVTVFKINGDGSIDPEYQSEHIVDAGGEIVVDFQDQLRHVTGWYEPSGTDAIMAIWMEVRNSTEADWECAAVDGPTGRFLPSACSTVFICTQPTSTATIDYIHLDEYRIAGDPVIDYA